MTDISDPVHLPIRLQLPAEELAEELRGVFAPETVAACLLDSYTQLAVTARIDTYLPLLAARFARERLLATARVEGHLVPDTPDVLFVCVHNAGRSQMAAALLAHHAAGRVHVRSAGSAPAESINPAVVEALAEVGLDVGQELPKPLTTEAVQASDVVITMGCGDACPVYPGKRYLDWDLDDPAGQPLEKVRVIRDDIDGRVRALLTELVPDS
ncbi:MAG: arsenate reductase ArsC [Actinomycetes bacterium]